MGIAFGRLMWRCYSVQMVMVWQPRSVTRVFFPWVSCRSTAARKEWIPELTPSGISTIGDGRFERYVDVVE